MALSPKVEECLSSLKEAFETSDKIEKIRRVLLAVAAGLGDNLDTFYFTNIQAPSIAEITMGANKQGIDGKEWPTPEIIQELVVKYAKAKLKSKEAYAQMPTSEQRSIQFPPGWR